MLNPEAFRLIPYRPECVYCNVKCGFSLDLGLDTDCDGVGFHELKAIDFDLKTPSGMDREQVSALD